MGKEIRVFGPPGCLDAKTIIQCRRGKRNSSRSYTIEEAYHKFHRLPWQKKKGWNKNIPTQILSLKKNIINYHIIDDIVYSGVKELFRVTSSDGKSIDVTIEHPFKIPDGDRFLPLQQLKIGSEICCRQEEFSNKGKSNPNNNNGNTSVKIETIIKIENVGYHETYDIVMTDPYHNYVVNGFIVHNTGKTSKLANEIIPELIDKYGHDKVMLTSFTKAAARELSVRVQDIEPTMVGTLHSFCFRALKQPPLTEKYLSDWNDSYPKYNLQVDDSLGLKCLAQYQIYRNKMIPESFWVPNITAFAHAWQQWKDTMGYMDFVDIIEHGGKFFSPPGSPRAIVCDEAQDMSKLEMKLLRQWGIQVSELWLVGDPDQCSPKGTMVSTNFGQIPIQQLENDSTTLIYAFKKGSSLSVPELSEFQINSRQYTGMMYIVSAGKNITRCTSNHKWFVYGSRGPETLTIDVLYEQMLMGRSFDVPINTDNNNPILSRCKMEVSRHLIKDITVYSLNVDKHHTYISDNIGTCNCIYSFSGASANNMLLPEIPQEDKIFINKSWRVPRAVHEVAQRVINRVTNREKDSVMEPCDREGKVSYGSDGYVKPEWVVEDAYKQTGTSMILTSCNYMLQPVISELRDRGIPFSNPWRKEEKAWNPLNTKGTEVLKAFVNTGVDEDYWDVFQFVQWAEHLKVGPDGLIRKQGKAGIKQLKEILETAPSTPGLHTCREFLSSILSPDAILKAISRDVEWLFQNLVKAKQTTIAYALRVYEKNGHEALIQDPTIWVGTCHSIKGAESDNVYLYPDISFASYREAETKEGYDNLCRLFYVGVTRAREHLILMPQATRNFFEI